jgi:hypothetical protein
VKGAIKVCPLTTVGGDIAGVTAGCDSVIGIGGSEEGKRRVVPPVTTAVH